MSNQAISNSHLFKLAEEWLAELSLAAATRRAYEMEVRRLVSWLSTNGQGAPVELTEAQVLGFLACLSSSSASELQRAGVRRALKSSSLSQTRRILGAFLMWCAGSGHVALATALALKRWDPFASASPNAKGLTQPLPETGGARKARGVSTPYGRMRTDFASALASWTGASPKELALLRSTSIKPRGRALEVKLPKPNGGVSIAFAPAAVVELWRKLRQERPSTVYALAGRKDGDPLSVSSVGRMLRARTDTSGPSGYRHLRSEGVRAMRLGGFTEAEINRQLRRRQPSIEPFVASSGQILSRMRGMKP